MIFEIILKIPGHDPNFGIKAINPTVLNKQSPMISREVIGHFASFFGGRSVLISHSSSSMLPKYAYASM